MQKEQLLAELSSSFAALNTQELEALAVKAVEVFPEEAFGYAYLAESFLAQPERSYLRAEVCLAKAIELEDSNLAYKLRFAEIKAEQGMNEDAEIIYRQVLRQDPNNAVAAHAIGVAELHHYENALAALDYFDKALAQAPDNRLYLSHRAEALFKLERFEDGEAALAQAMQGDFLEEAVAIKIGYHVAKNDLHAAIAAFELLVTHRPDVLDYRQQYGSILNLAGNYAAATTQLQKATELLDPEEPFDPSLWNSYGQAALHANQSALAKSIFDKIIENDPEAVNAHLQRAIAEMGLQNYKQALADIDKAAALAGDSPIYTEQIELKKALCLFYLGKLDEAEAAFTTIAKTGMAKQEAYYGVALVHHKRGNTASAYKFLKSASRHIPAKQYIKEHFTAYLTDLKKSILEKNAGEIAKNAANEGLQKIMGLWVFSAIKSKKMEGFPEEMAKNMSAELQGTAMLWTEKGMMLVDKDRKEEYTYVVEKISDDNIQVQFLPLDGVFGYSAKIKVANGAMIFSKEEGEAMQLKATAASAMPIATKNLFKNHLSSPQQLAFLGEKAKPVAAVLAAQG